MTSALGSADAITASMSVMPYMSTTIRGNTVTAPIAIAEFIMMGTRVPGRGISSAICVAPSVPPYVYLLMVSALPISPVTLDLHCIHHSQNPCCAFAPTARSEAPFNYIRGGIGVLLHRQQDDEVYSKAGQRYK
jgi:hypothetical protein